MKGLEELSLEVYPVKYQGEVGRSNPDRNAPLREAFRKGWGAYQDRVNDLAKAMSELDIDAALDAYIYGRPFVSWFRDDSRKCVMVVLPDGSKGLVTDWRLTASKVSPDTMHNLALHFFMLFMTTIQDLADELEGSI